MDLTERDLASILEAEPLKCPDRTGIKPGATFFLWVKIGGEMQLATVVCRGEAYPRTLQNGGIAWYVDVYGYGVRDSVNIKKLRSIPR